MNLAVSAKIKIELAMSIPIGIEGSAAFLMNDDSTRQTQSDGPCYGKPCHKTSTTAKSRRNNAYVYGIEYLYTKGSWAMQPASSRQTTLISLENALYIAGNAITTTHRHVKRWRLLSPRFIIPKIHPKYTTEMKKRPDTNRINCIHVC